VPEADEKGGKRLKMALKVAEDSSSAGSERRAAVILSERRAEVSRHEDRARDRRNSKWQDPATCPSPRTGQHDPAILRSFGGARVLG
jgi:hypothetical protein